MTHIFGENKPPERMCRCCGCTEANACVTDAGPCAWILLDIETPTGVCSACAAATKWDQKIIVEGWHPEAVKAIEQMMGEA